ncbi:MAG TPA: hypothetical protein VIF09_28005, partial [Polyangiaceae bacterium]
GEHQLTIEAAGFRPYKRPFLVHAGETFSEDARLESETPATLPPTYEGLYSGLEFLGFATPSGASNQIAKSCPGAPCRSSSPLGAGLGVRVGYAWGWIAAEALAFGTYDHSTGSDSVGTGSGADVARNESYVFHRFGGGLVVGPRVASKNPHLRFTGALLGGFATMATIYDQSVSSTIGSFQAQNTSATTTYVAPAMMLDAGVLVGWASGAKVHVALVTELQFVGTTNAPALGTTSLGTGTYTTGPLQVAQGTQVFVGPMIGFDFGL